MAILSKEDLFKTIQDIVGEDTSDEMIKRVQDITETVNSFEANSGEDWKKKYEDNDREWRKKYRDTFYDTSVGDDDGEKDDPKPLTYENLFTKG